MDTVFPGLSATAPQTLSFAPSLVIRGFLLKRDEGNLLIYSANTLEREVQRVRENGGIWRQYLNHHHEASPTCDWVARTFDAPLHCHERDRPEASRACKVDETFSERHVLGGDFQVIPTPGHTRGATAYLWDTGRRRCLFTGDTIYLRGDGAWTAAVLPSSDRDAYIESLQLIRDLDFDVLVPSIAVTGEDYYALTNVEDRRQRINAILERVRHGHDE